MGSRRVRTFLGRIRTRSSSHSISGVSQQTFGKGVALFSSLSVNNCASILRDPESDEAAVLSLQNKCRRGSLPSLDVTERVLDGLCRRGKQDEAYALLRQLYRLKGFRDGAISAVSASVVINCFMTRGDTDTALRIHRDCVVLGIVLDLQARNDLIHALATQRRFMEALEVLQALEADGTITPSSSSYHNLLEPLLAASDHLVTAYHLSRWMRSQGFPPEEKLVLKLQRMLVDRLEAVEGGQQPDLGCGVTDSCAALLEGMHELVGLGPDPESLVDLLAALKEDLESTLVDSLTRESTGDSLNDQAESEEEEAALEFELEEDDDSDDDDGRLP